MKTSPPVYQTPAPDPMLAQQQAQAETDKITALQGKLKGDTSSIMSQYGLLAMLGGSGGGSPLMGK